ncbi:MAG: PilN domain-containing protein [Gammaproteobacteria bacterium]|nr:PilN domain-containing protein [Gammaproteobacteria bacterium]MDH3411076.1 PilN domain-containing protein [Gammaproteobacteria bacterium]
MAEMDLIPAAYRQKLRIAELLRNFVLICAGVIVLIAAAKVGLGLLIQRAGPVRAQHLQLEATSRSQRERITALTAQRAKAELQERILASLRGDSDIVPLFVAIDKAITRSVWFLEMKFTREGALVKVKPEAVNTGYFIVVPKGAKDANPQAEEQAWRTEKHVEIKGIAADHTALAEFMRALDSQPGIDSVSLLNTGTRSYTTRQVVDFSIAATLSRDMK